LQEKAFACRDLEASEGGGVTVGREGFEEDVELASITPAMTSASLTKTASQQSVTTRRKSRGCFGDTRSAESSQAYASLARVERYEDDIKDILLEHVLEIAFKLRKEGVIAEPPLDWDGSLGPDEEKVIKRLGFLLNAYTVQAWWFERI